MTLANEVKPIEAEVVAIEPRTLGPLGINPRTMIAEASEMATVLAEVINAQHLFAVISQKKYVTCEGWTTMGAMLGVVAVEDYVKQIEHGYEARVKLVKVKDGSMVGGASAICTHEEPLWMNRPPYALRSMSLTRATSKAYRLAFSWIIKLAGYECTPAEEMVSDEMRGSKEAAQEVLNRKTEQAKKELGLSATLQASVDQAKNGTLRIPKETPINLPPVPSNGSLGIREDDLEILYYHLGGETLRLRGEGTMQIRKSLKQFLAAKGGKDENGYFWDIDQHNLEGLEALCQKTEIRLIKVQAA